VFFTEAVYLAMNKMEVPSSEVGLLQLKGIAEKIRVYKVVREKRVGDASGKATARLEATVEGAGSAAPIESPAWAAAPIMQDVSRRRRILAFAFDAVLCAFLINALFTYSVPVDVDVAETTEEATDEVQINDDGVKVGDSVEISAERVRVGEALRIDKDGVQIDSKKFDEKTGEKLAVAIDAILKEKERVESLEPREFVSFSLFWFLYSAFFLTVWGATPGKRLFRIRIVRADGGPVDWKVSLIRALFSVISLNFAMLGYAWGFFSDDRRTWHDRIAATRAIRGVE